MHLSGARISASDRQRLADYLHARKPDHDRPYTVQHFGCHSHGRRAITGVTEFSAFSLCCNQSNQFGASCTILPPTIVISDEMSRMPASSTPRGSALGTARSASLPGSSDPFLASSKVR